MLVQNCHGKAVSIKIQFVFLTPENGDPCPGTRWSNTCACQLRVHDKLAPRSWCLFPWPGSKQSLPCGRVDHTSPNGNRMAPWNFESTLRKK